MNVSDFQARRHQFLNKTLPFILFYKIFFLSGSRGIRDFDTPEVLHQRFNFV